MTRKDAEPQYIWQRQDWPNFAWDSQSLLPLLSQVRKQQGQIIAQASSLGLEIQTKIVTDEALTTSAIEGETLDRNSVRSSVARRLGIVVAGTPSPPRHIDGLVEMLLDATQNWQEDLTSERLQAWQAALFPTGYSGLNKIQVGSWRRGDDPMQVLSKGGKHTVIHFEAPPSKIVPREMKAYLHWWLSSKKDIDGLIRAGIAHFYFLTIHPFDDGNGRLARTITDLALAQDEKTSLRLYSMSSQIIKHRKSYYETLEKSQKQTCDITVWLHWFLETLGKAILDSQHLVQRAFDTAQFWQKHADNVLNTRQRKVLQKLIDAEPLGFEGGLTNRKYVSLTKTSRETAKRDLIDLESKGLLKRNPGLGRSVSYSLRK